MVKKDSLKLSVKLKTIEVIVKELMKIEENDRQDIILFALKQVGFKNIPDTAITSALPSPVRKDREGDSGNGLDMGMDRFVKNKKPENEYQRVAVIAYYLDKKENKKEFKNAEMSKANTNDARQPKISNITDVVTKAQNRYKFLTKGTGKATHQLSVHGEDIVEALPDHVKVKELIASAKSRKSKKKKKNKK
ncbi:MAG: hypothetical protein Q8M92_09310 [Candidatus Subteraquimicrobiales bacterium]|nr:hypothetical protein [Candidatus Subteraquimicrobiales bacterium]